MAAKLPSVILVPHKLKCTKLGQHVAFSRKWQTPLSVIYKWILQTWNTQQAFGGQKQNVTGLIDKWNGSFPAPLLQKLAPVNAM